jgi:hypothetical protein
MGRLTGFIISIGVLDILDRGLMWGSKWCVDVIEMARELGRERG